MTLTILATLFLLIMLAGYFSYGSMLTKLFQINPQQKTPAHTCIDNKEFIPTHPFYLFCQHFSAISASGPIAGPIIACQKWGWLPCILWILLGVIFIGAVHDFSTLTASVRHKGCSIAEIAKEHMGKRAGIFLLIFIWIALVYIIVAFTQVTAGSFVAASEELKSIDVDFNPGGAVAASAVFYLLLCLILGILNKTLKLPLWLTTIIFIPATFFSIWLGTNTSYLIIFDQKTFEVSILIYCGIASLLPIWLLLQPRGYLGGFILFFVIAIGFIGMFFGNYEIKQPAYLSTMSSNSLSHLFPFLFVTIACGACSGFHGLVCGGTTSKQISNEKHLQPIGYGAMLSEAIVALIALSTIMIFSTEDIFNLKPGTIYGNGIGKYLTLVIGKEHLPFATTLGAMAFSTFVFDTLDVATRISRYLIQELFSWKKAITTYLATFITLALPLLIVVFSNSSSWVSFWTLFGSANQLLAALSLLGITLWLIKSKRPFLITLLPMTFILCITLWSLIEIAKDNFLNATKPIQIINGTAALILIALALFIVCQSAWHLYKKT